MSDPAVQAAERAVPKHYYGITSTPTPAEIDSAREALKPLRELHRPVRYGPDITDEAWIECVSCVGAYWPCESAKRIYPESELS